MLFDLPDLSATEALGRRLGERLFPGAVVALVGPLGAGKTHFARAIAEGLGLENSRVVTSPTFVLIQEYPARIPIAHFDVYRLRSAAEFEDLGPGEYFAGPWVSLIEWADRVESLLPPEHLRVELQIVGANHRRAELTPFGERYERLVEELASAGPGP
ncbi:MAG TPA: tRNA (adenosine(37)-N6)-threonylcarbamoyltransferase complex ATPase subunit type 1 TsaE [Gemmataceae bacterium]